MALETKDILEALDLGDDVTTLDQLKEKHSKKFVTLSSAHENEEIKSKVVGKVLGSLTTHAKKAFDLTPDEIKDKKLEEVLEIASSKYKNKFTELETSSKKGKDELVIDLETKLEKYKKDALEFKSAADLASKALQEKEGLFEEEKKGWKRNSLFDTVKKDLDKELISDIDPLKLKGFNTEIAEKYIFEVDETGEALAVYNKDKTRVQDPKKLGSFLSPKDLLVQEASKNKLIKMNTANTATKVVSELNKKETTTTTTKISRLNPDNLHPNVRKRMGL